MQGREMEKVYEKQFAKKQKEFNEKLEYIQQLEAKILSLELKLSKYEKVDSPMSESSSSSYMSEEEQISPKENKN
jgi:hypothetical protein